MRALSPTDIFELCDLAYVAKEKDELSLGEEVSRRLGFLVDRQSIRRLNGKSGALFSAQSGFGFLARGTGARKNELILATRGTASLFDVGTDINFVPTHNSAGGPVHRGFKNTFDSYSADLDRFIKQAMPGLRPTKIHCMGHSLGGALANLNAAALAEQGYGVNLYTLASPRVGMIGFAEHLSKKVKTDHIHRVAHMADPVTMVPCFPFMHAPMASGYVNLARGHLLVNLAVHGMDVGYKAIKGQSWHQLRSANQAVERRLVHSATRRHDAMAQMSLTSSAPQLVMHSATLLKNVGFLINDLLNSQGRGGMITAQHWHTGAFTTLDQLAELLYRCSMQGKQAAEKVVGVVSAIQRFLGYAHQKTTQVTRAVLVHTFKMLHSALMGMVRLAIGR